ncbi:uncharacterized protein LOC126898528 [Daktulosphaira vitifoliae]|uniref:uncharacterized protein LOC126898528 n=1 Tax=Daktulosphaira vitifoliae TaxID=58002 RepID=UPI0021AAAD24|nr:uncharacterized protein LOC126898528 [Daktulosphaira vitifoliae]XP_050528599.1 uncharacterized protein LOC126898528 [Daktulosphaira vitifoliae]XP_050528600.1 uncharacterized protein LOC126898528 [Daktulosphaira vitifoliae]XP_050528601.1 uncharacterized protein LOC126898528 [Daktulosphaira vitifoliae]
MNDRFSEESLKLAVAVDKLIKLDFENSMDFFDHYLKLTRCCKKSLEAEIVVAKSCLLKKNANFDLTDMVELITPSVYPNLFKYLQLAITIPISSATCERSFSAMRRVKTWLRTTMEQTRFSSLSVLHIERDLSNNINVEDIVNVFAEKERRILLK